MLQKVGLRQQERAGHTDTFNPCKLGNSTTRKTRRQALQSNLHDAKGGGGGRRQEKLHLGERKTSAEPPAERHLSSGHVMKNILSSPRKEFAKLCKREKQETKKQTNSRRERLGLGLLLVLVRMFQLGQEICIKYINISGKFYGKTQHFLNLHCHF